MDINIDEIVEQVVTETLRKERQAKYNKRPYMDLSDRRRRQQDHTKTFKDVYDLVKDDLKGNDEDKKGLAHLKLGYVLKELAGRPLTTTEMKNIIVHCEAGHRTGRWKINAFGQLYCTKEMNGNDWETK